MNDQEAFYKRGQASTLATCIKRRPTDRKGHYNLKWSV